MTKIFCDTADINVIKKFSRKNIVKGFTTNPSLMRKAGAKNYKIYSKMILQESKNKPVSLEVFADDYDNMKKQAFEIASWEKNIYVKIPVVNSKNLFTGKLIRELSAKKIKLNITAVYTFKQAKKIISCLDKKSKCIISMFIGRAADAGKDPIPFKLKKLDVKLLQFRHRLLIKLKNLENLINI
jgi:transaldolase